MNSKELIVNTLSNVVPDDIAKEQIEKLIEKPKSSDLGDYAFPTFILAKSLHKAPNMIAKDLVAEINQDGFEKIVNTGAYVNFFLDKGEFSNDILHTVLKEQADYGDQNQGKGGNVPIDMSSPNIAKPMSMGHLRSTVIGNSIAKIISKLGYSPIKINHLGDWGTQFGKLIVGYKKWGSEAEVEEDPINNLLKYYVRFHKEAEEKPELDDEARAWFKKMEDGDKDALALWTWFRKLSLSEFQKVYDRLGVEFDSYNGEAFYNDKMDDVIKTIQEKGLLEESRGAEIVDLSAQDLSPALIRKTDGATLYITRDLAAAIYRKNTYNFVKSLYVVGSEQSEHFKKLKAVLKMMGYDWSDDIHHIEFGLITTNGKKLSTRKGRVILLENVLNDAVDLAKKQIEEKNPGLENKDQVAEDVGVGAVIFHDLKNERRDNFDFNLEEVVRFEGETGPYVQYTNARALSILRKVGDVDYASADSMSLSDPEAWDTIKLIQEFPEIVSRAGEKYEPSVIAKYSLKLAKSFNQYYAHSKILTEDDGLNARLALVKSVSIVLQMSLNLLGVNAPEEM
ncbi:arginine--tRNA ligase [Companilactobacillus mishanensis]|uniref:Arginine--tRNA ligase n=1 Tax=Companilactobacillus mishanensis TaxID=2486008 RepID=A0ABW9P5L0_9LACO|nr:arginine--tRNA ligase [Companilactobacillus mishanensis]MQS44510.1 arginine--tRNA ligase [Companilactobacillus mishanensis]MQS88753.1 arginine--tRNA ligase [Companilactobacillus mishanensis]